MEKITIQHNENFEYIHQNLGISDARADELEKQIKEEIIKGAVTNGIVIINEEEGSVNLSSARVMDYLINKIATTHAEQLFLMMHVDPITHILDGHIKEFGGGIITADED